MKNRLCQLLGIRYPIIQGPMAWISGFELVAAVSNAGGLGTIAPNAGATFPTKDIAVVEERIREQIRKTKSLTSKPFAVNIAVGMGYERAFSDLFVEICIDEGVEVAVVSQGSAGVYTARLKENGIKSDDYVYNSISNLKNPKELDLLKKNKIKSVVVLILGSNEMSSTQRFNYITGKNQPGDVSIIDGLKQMGIDKIWIDGGVIGIESFSHILDTQQMVSNSLKLPVGTAPTLFLFKYSSPRLNLKFHTKYRKASIMFIASWFSNFIFYGAIEDAEECFASVYQALELKKVMKNNNIRLFDNYRIEIWYKKLLSKFK